MEEPYEKLLCIDSTSTHRLHGINDYGGSH